MISNIIKKEFLSIDSPVNMVVSRKDNNGFYSYIRRILPNANIIGFGETYYANFEPHIILCNSRVLDIDRSIELARFFHIPLFIIDTEIKSEMISNNIQTTFDFGPVIQIAISNNISLSWNNIHNYIIELSKDIDCIDKWRNIIYTSCRDTFKLQTKITQS